MNLESLIKKYIENGYKYIDAESQVSQDIILSKISNSKYREHITIKGGVVMHSISNNIRRATRDLDLDFIKYSLDDTSIINFLNNLNAPNDKIKIELNGKITKLHQQDYEGKRVYINIIDNYGNSIKTKLDIGVHKLFNLEQDNYCFDFNVLNKKANLLINSKEQIFVEKLKSLLKFGVRSTRYKDLFDFYYLITECDLDKGKLYMCIAEIIYNNESMRENNISDIINRLQVTFSSKVFKRNLNNPMYNWLDVPIDEAIDVVLNYVKELDRVSIS